MPSKNSQAGHPWGSSFGDFIKLGGNVIQITAVPEITDIDKEKSKDKPQRVNSEYSLGDVGQYDECTQVIEIEDGIPEQFAQEVFLHEMVHAMTFKACIYLSEDDTERLAQWLHDFLTNNELPMVGCNCKKRKL